MENNLLKTLFVFTLSLWLNQVVAQPNHPNKTDKQGLRQGRWTILYDEDWNIIADKQQAVYYRVIEYQNDRPTGIVKDFFRNGTTKMVAILLTDRPQDIYDGTVIWYREDGSKQKEAQYINGALIGSPKLFDKRGREWTETWQEVNSTGASFYNRGEPNKAFDFWEKGIELAELEYGKKNENYAIALNHIGLIYYHRKDWTNCITYFKKAIEVLESIQKTDIEYYGTITSNLAGVYLIIEDTSKLEEAEKFFLNNLKIKENIFKKNSEQYANALDNLAKFYIKKRDKLLAIKTLEESIEVFESIQIKNPYFYITTLIQLGSLYQETNQVHKTEAVYEKALEIFVERLGKKHSQYPRLLKILSDFYILQGKRELAEKLLQENLQENALSKREKPLEYAKSLEDLAFFYYEIGEYLKAMPRFQEAIILYENQIGKNSQEYLAVKNKIASIQQYLGKSEEAEKLYLEVLKAQEELVGKFDVKYAIALNNIAVFYNEVGEQEKAQNAIEEAQKILEINQKQSTTFYANILNIKAVFLTDQNQYDLAEKSYQEALSIFEKTEGKNSESYANSLHNLAGLYEKQGRHLKAIGLFEEAISIRKIKIGTKHPYYLRSVYSLAISKQKMGYISQADSLLLSAQKTLEEGTGVNTLDYANVLSNLGTLYSKLNRNKESLEYYQKAIRTFEVIGQKNSPSYLKTRISLASLLERMNRSKESEELYVETIMEAKKVKNKDEAAFALYLNNLAYFYQQQGRNEQALPLYQESLQIRQKVLGANHPDCAESLHNIAALYFDTKQYIKADSAQRASIKIYELQEDFKNPKYIILLEGLTQIIQKTGKTQEAQKSYQQIIPHYLEQIQRNFPAFTEDEKLRFLQQFKDKINAFYSFVIDYAQSAPKEEVKIFVEQMYNLRLTTKAILLESSNKMRQNIYQSKDAVLIQKFENWKQKKDSLALIYQMPIAERRRNGIYEKELEKQINQMERELSQSSELFSQEIQRKLYTWQEIQQSLLPNESAIELIRVRHFQTDKIHYIVLLLTSQTQKSPELILLDGNELEKNIKSHLALIEKAKENTQDYSQIWQTIEQKIKEKMQVANSNTKPKLYFSADGVFHTINLNTIKYPQTEQFVIDKWEIHLVNNTKDLLTKPKTNALIPSGNPAVLMGFPDYYFLDEKESTEQEAETGNNSSTKRGFKDVLNRDALNFDSLKALPNTKIEVNKIDSLLRRNKIATKVYLGKEASESIIKKLRSPSLLFIGTHGYFLSDNPENKEKSKKMFSISDTTFLYRNPLFYSGLFLAGSGIKVAKNIEKQPSKNPKEDGILTAYEVANLNLENTDLVVLSACETGLGEITDGEGVFGLQRVFQTAGGKCVIMSLWNVDDKITQEFMVDFFDNWLKTKNRRQAFINAQLKIKTKYLFPKHWGAFVMIGD